MINLPSLLQEQLARECAREDVSLVLVSNHLVQDLASPDASQV